jgi:putative inorganic carbon (HCO3(-)) transporter
MRLHGPTWSYAHPNSFSGTQLGTLPYLYHLAPLGPKSLRIAMALQAVAALVIILYCGSRTAYLGFFAWLAILIARARSSTKAIIVLVVITVAIAPFIPAQYVARMETVYTQKEIEGASIDTRKEILGDAWKIFTNHPLGVGVGAFPVVRERTFGRNQDTHNLYLEVATNLGFIGFTLFIGLVLSMLRTLLAVARKIDAQLAEMDLILPSGKPVGPLQHAAAKHRSDLRTMAAAAGATSSFLIIRLILGAFGHDLYEIYWWFMLGLAVALNRMEPAALLKTQWLKEQTAKAAA